jgi:Zn finger protein HypA/HybF involved in hydrogenase expression
MHKEREVTTDDPSSLDRVKSELVTAGRYLLETSKRLARALIEPLKEDDELENFRLSSPETQTTTIDGDVGWAKRPPAFVQCSNCESEIFQESPRDELDCPRCTSEYTPQEFPELDLLHMACPVCNSEMEHGRRHPNSIPVPEWATCHRCRYHWEFAHDYQNQASF